MNRVSRRSITNPRTYPNARASLQRKCACGNHAHAGAGECETCHKKQDRILQRAATNDAPRNQVPSIVHDVLRSPGQQLDETTRAFMEPRFGYDFSNVRVHTGSRPAQSAQSVNALAYTVGRDVVFGEGQYQPATSEGRRLLAHELAHVVQQNGNSASGQLSVGDPHSIYEMEAASSGNAVTLPVNHIGSGILQRSGKSSEQPGLCGGTRTCASSQDCLSADNVIIGPMPLSTWWKLKVMIDVEASSAADVTQNTPGHAYVEFSESNGNRYSYGFYPHPSTIPTDFRYEVFGCVVHPDKIHTACVDYREEFVLTQKEYKSALDSAQLFCKAPPKYHLFNWNCTTFVDFIVKRADKNLPAIKGKVGRLVSADNPNTLLEGLRARDAARGQDAGKR